MDHSDTSKQSHELCLYCGEVLEDEELANPMGEYWQCDDCYDDLVEETLKVHKENEP